VNPAQGTQPRVSVVMPVFNRPGYIATAIESVLAQTYADFELLVIDDGSTDHTPEVVASFRDPRIRLVRHPQNLGITATRSHGLELARGEYVATLDSDDWAHPLRLARQVAFLDAHPDHALVGSWVGRMGPRGRAYRVQARPVRCEDVHVQLLFGGAVVNSSTLGRTALLRRHGYRTQYPVRQDFDLFVRLAAHHPLANLPYPLTRCRHHPEQATRARGGLVRDMNLSIFASQLDALGVAFDAADVARHYTLPRLGRTKLQAFGLRMEPDPLYLQWAEAWLTKLWEANRRVGRYDPAALERELGWLLCSLAWQTATRGRLGSLRRLRGSSLRRMATAGLAHRLCLHIRSSLARLDPHLHVDGRGGHSRPAPAG
jgi:glycosyltransferase involved in cell wall biosynthesis